jgi:glyoxylase-like metal-dependent hydrolase (beta-lactamase superfamily II)
VLIGPDGKLLVDAGITASRPRIIEALASLSSDPIQLLINTHWHFDHTDGNEWLHGEGATILAHENTRNHLARAQRVEDWNFNFPASPAGAIPTDVFATDRTIKVNGSTLTLKYYGPAHTDGDISVAFTDADILHTPIPGRVAYSATKIEVRPQLHPVQQARTSRPKGCGF